MLGEWYADLFTLTAGLKAKLEQALEMRQGKTLICAQIRLGGRRTHFKDSEQFNERNVSVRFWNLMREKLIGNLTREQYRLFVTSDEQELIEEAALEFGVDELIQTPGESFHIDKMPMQGNNCTAVEKTMLDFHMMQHCDMAVVSSSGYGISALLNRRERMIANFYVLNFVSHEFERRKISQYRCHPLRLQ